MATQRVSQMTFVTPQTRYKNLGGNWNNFAGGNQSADDLRAFMAGIVGRPAQAVTAGGTLTINSQSLGSYDYTIKSGDQTISSFTAGDWFTTTEDTRSSLIAVNGNLTINAGQTFTPSVRKLFTCIYVNGNLTVNGSISMSSRGANHSATSAAAIKLISNGTYQGVTNPQIPATGGAGVGVNSNGTAGTDGGTGAGGGGVKSGSGGGGAGAAGTSFSGGAAGGSSWNAFAGNGAANGGAGGNSGCGGSGGNAGGAGNPAGSPCNSGTAGSNGTGGVLIIFVTGTYSGTGSITASGATGGGCTGDCHAAGSGSGGGSVSIFCTTNSTGPTPTATGGSRGNMGGNGGDRIQGLFGGAGTARIMAGAF
jgi:hypothetical protein